MPNLTIALDAMGGDFGPHVTIPAAINILKKYKNLSIYLVGNETEIIPLLQNTSTSIKSRYTIIPSLDDIPMDLAPALALRNFKQSSMRMALNLVREGKAQACVSAGNTGALMVLSRHLLKVLPFVDRPALVSTLPSVTMQPVYMLDLGVNVSCDADALLQFALMGSALAEHVGNIPAPRVALLNVGQEDIKGNDLVKHAAQLLSKHHNLNYIGFIEGNDIFSGKADVIVCDGFTGNVALKTSEGVVDLVISQLTSVSNKNILTKLLSLLVKPLIMNSLRRLKPDQYNGATLLGLPGIVIKSHGNAEQVAFEFAIEQAVKEVESGLVNKISASLDVID
ncbi:phosphate acyltransferase PlsX [Moritella sp. Urea-trap-13]|uniref:phosphate acyltransferase PlsX n=1 Tax=Moritella sp. Urea-trap-13 TaxID=2058327 RepID=UPI000C338828|nr:phosphate acyltransferase PlsX [Moritella sp. Urea-trap-13]PKH06460.1 phosphate acyltransferase PlsX [Moritella sp. Urea-trap-13]